MTTKPGSLLLIPGLLCTGDLWAAQIAALSGAYDIHVADTTRHSSMPEIASSILADAPASFALAGLSMGGYVALEMHRQAPHRIERLALLDTKAAADSPEQLARRRGFMELARKGKFRGVTPQLLPSLIHKDHLDNELLRETIFRMAREIGPEAFLRQQQAIVGRIDYMAELPLIKCPTLVLCGAGDMLTPPELHRDMAARIPNARLVVVEDAGHLTPLEQPEAVTRALRDWLEMP